MNSDEVLERLDQIESATLELLEAQGNSDISLRKEHVNGVSSRLTKVVANLRLVSLYIKTLHPDD